MATTTPRSAGHSSAQRPSLLARLQQFWQRVTEGLAVSQLWSQFETETRSSYRLYSRDVQAKTPEGLTTRGRRLHVLKEFFWAVLEKLSPARRVLLLLALIMLMGPWDDLRYQDSSGGLHGIQFNSQFWAGLLLFLLLMLEIADRVVMKRDLQIAREIQTWLLPGAPPQIPGLAIAYSTRPANTVAGDYYDVFQRPGKTPEENRLIFAVTTAFLAEYDPVRRIFTYINAGHNQPILRRDGGFIERLDVGGLPLGIQAEARYESASVVLAPGDWLVIFTDGLVEAVNARDEEYDEPRLLHAIEAGTSGRPCDMLERLMAELDLFVGNTPQHDDVTCMLLKAEAC